jgi:hypothetical protein
VYAVRHASPRLRLADASALPIAVSGDTNAASIMIDEKAPEMSTAEEGEKTAEIVGQHPANRR